MKRHKKGIGDDQTKMIRSQTVNDKYKIECKKSTLCIILFTIISSIILTNFYLLNSSLGGDHGFNSNLPISADVLILYQKYDLNSDGSIDINEFEPLALKFLEIKLDHDYDVAISDDDEFITLNAFFEPMDTTKLSLNKYEFL
ncbi:seleno N-like, partial [Brachionus plicatilis]